MWKSETCSGSSCRPHKREGHDIAVIDVNAGVLTDISNSFDVMGLIGNGASHAVQVEAGIETADLLVAATDSDELNLLCCLIAKKAGGCSTVARVAGPVPDSKPGIRGCD